MRAIKPNKIFRLIYTSHSLVNQIEIVNAVPGFASHNQEKGITGFLLIIDNKILQILEGEISVVKNLMSQIEIDPRHKDVLITVETIEMERLFPDWSLKAMTPEDKQFYILMDKLHQLAIFEKFLKDSF